MFFDHRNRRIARRASLGLALVGAGACALAATNPAGAASTFDAFAKVVTCGTSAACFAAKNTGSGPAIAGTSTGGTGVQATGGKYGVHGSSGSSSGTGVYGSSASGYGLYGTTSSGNGYGVVGSVSSSGTGVYGFSQSSYGVEALSSDGYGIYANAYGSGTAMYAASNSGYGLVAYSNGSVPIYARNSAGNGGDFEGTYIGIIGRAPASGGYPLTLTDENGNDLFYVDGAGNVSYHGGLFNFARVGGGAMVKSFTAKTTLPTVEDTGTARLVDGVSAVRLDPTFAASIEQSASYRVFVTPNGDTRGLFVATKSATGFLVRESQGGRSSVSFDYRIVATALGQAGQRMAVVDASHAPHAQAPRPPVIKSSKSAVRVQTP